VNGITPLQRGYFLENLTADQEKALKKAIGTEFKAQGNP
jgi:hypothetical protein